MSASPNKQRIVLAGERLLAKHGLQGVSLRRIAAEAGHRNHFAVQYHFGSRDNLIQAIFEYRMRHLYDRQEALIAGRRPDQLRCWIECYLLPILEQGELEGSHYLTFISMLRQSRRADLFAKLPGEFQASTRFFREQVAERLPHVPEPLRAYRISQALLISVHAASDREQSRARGESVLPFPHYKSDLVNGIVGFLSAPVSAATVDT
jgi:AcrR family transcriptional regulator